MKDGYYFLSENLITICSTQESNSRFERPLSQLHRYHMLRVANTKLLECCTFKVLIMSYVKIIYFIKLKRNNYKYLLLVMFILILIQFNKV